MFSFAQVAALLLLKMVRNYKRVSERKQWNDTDLSAAMDAVREGGCSVKESAENYGIPRQTLARHLQSPEQDAKTNGMGRFKTVFSREQEEELVHHVLEMEKRFYGLTCLELRSLAFQLAERNNIPHPFNRSAELAGEGWLSGFRKRHEQLSLRIPEQTSIARAQGFNEVAVGKFYDLLQDVLITQKFTPDRIYNVDETSVLTVQYA